VPSESFRSVIPERAEPPPTLDTSVAHSARVYDYWLGGKDNFAADREAGDQVIAVRPAIRADVRANRAFLGRAIRFLAADAGVYQFLDIGTGIPAAANTHEVAQAAAPRSRIVYVDNDPVVLTHARALLTSCPEGATAYLDADMCQPETILRSAAHTLDFGQPVAVVLVAVLHHVPDAQDPWGIVRTLMAAVPPGSHLVISHLAADIETQAVTEVARRYNALVPAGQKRRTLDEVTRFFDGLELLRPGVVQTVGWRPAPGDQTTRQVPMWAAVGRKP
jgi:hypothetical protein